MDINISRTNALARMVPPGQRRPNKKQMRDGVLQIMITRACDLSCFNCTQGSNLAGKPVMMSPDQFEKACISLRGYFGVVGVFGGNPALHPQFEEICRIMRKHIPFEQRGLWCNHPKGKGKIMRETFNPVTSNLNVHMSQEAMDEFKRDWPESRPFGLESDSRHSPCYVALKDILTTDCPLCSSDSSRQLGEAEALLSCPECQGTGKVYDQVMAWELIGSCDINQNWSALIGVFRGQLRAWFCEIAGAQSMLHQDEPDYPDTGLDPIRYYKNPKNPRSDQESLRWWELPMHSFSDQVEKHCHDCGVPLRGYGSLALDPSGTEQFSETHRSIYRTKKTDRRVELVTVASQLGDTLNCTVDYVGNGKRSKEDIIKHKTH